MIVTSAFSRQWAELVIKWYRIDGDGIGDDGWQKMWWIVKCGRMRSVVLQGKREDAKGFEDE